MQGNVGKTKKQMNYAAITERARTTALCSGKTSLSIWQTATIFIATCNKQSRQQPFFTCSGSTWQNMEIFSFTEVSNGVEHLQTI